MLSYTSNKYKQVYGHISDLQRTGEDADMHGPFQATILTFAFSD